MRLTTSDYETLLALVEARAQEEAVERREGRTERAKIQAGMDEMRYLDLAQRLRDHLKIA